MTAKDMQLKSSKKEQTKQIKKDVHRTECIFRDN